MLTWILNIVSLPLLWLMLSLSLYVLLFVRTHSLFLSFYLFIRKLLSSSFCLFICLLAYMLRLGFFCFVLAVVVRSACMYLELWLFESKRIDIKQLELECCLPVNFDRSCNKPNHRTTRWTQETVDIAKRKQNQQTTNKKNTHIDTNMHALKSVTKLSKAGVGSIHKFKTKTQCFCRLVCLFIPSRHHYHHYHPPPRLPRSSFSPPIQLPHMYM